MNAPDFSLEGKLAVVTGGSRGIGYAIAAAFVAQGARVVLTARNADPLRAAAISLGANAIGKPCDNADPAAIERTIEDVWRLGPVDVLVNNAGISPHYKRIEHFTVDEYDAVFDVNLRGSFAWSVGVARRLLEVGRPGSIINISSVTGTIPLERVGVYAASKAGLDQLTRLMALEWAPRGIRVNAIAPGWTETDFTDALFESRHGPGLLADIPMGRYAKPEDVTGAAVFLASEASAYVTGSVLLVDGGRSLR